jgi:hypothetical protein
MEVPETYKKFVFERVACPYADPFTKLAGTSQYNTQYNRTTPDMG